MGTTVQHPAVRQRQAALAEGSGLLLDYLAPRVRLYRDGVPCQPRITGTGVRTIADRAHDVIRMLYPCGGASAQIRYAVFFDDNDPAHQNLAKVTRDGGEREFVFTVAERELTVGRSSPWRQAWQFTRLGVEHIFTGYDHVLFVFSLLLGAGALRSVARIVTAFTAGHSVTLALATLGVVHLPPRLVEAAIALSIIYVAAENMFRRETAHRWTVALLFGLVHGFGFANVLAEMQLSRGGLAGSLLFISAVYPLLVYLRRFLAYPRVVFTGSAAVLAMGLFWFVERTFT